MLFLLGVAGGGEMKLLPGLINYIDVIPPLRTNAVSKTELHIAGPRLAEDLLHKDLVLEGGTT
ncbi:hypothetical protein U1Q18_006229, partial [Sarracenia purpurea var. burkii]